LEAEAGVKPRSPKGRATARGLDARLRLQHPFMPAGDAFTSSKMTEPIKRLSRSKKSLDDDHGIYRDPGSSAAHSWCWRRVRSASDRYLPARGNQSGREEQRAISRLAFSENRRIADDKNVNGSRTWLAVCRAKVVTRKQVLYRRTPTRLTPPFKLPPAL
jgi:hypothetical protein